MLVDPHAEAKSGCVECVLVAEPLVDRSAAAVDNTWGQEAGTQVYPKHHSWELEETGFDVAVRA